MGEIKVTQTLSTPGGQLKPGDFCLYMGVQYIWLCKIYIRNSKKTKFLLLTEDGYTLEAIVGKDITKGTL